MVNSVHNLYGVNVNFSLKERLYLLNLPKYGLYKVKVIYDRDVKVVEIAEYEKRKIDRLFAVFNDTINYRFKFLDRKCFDMCQTESQAEFLFIKNGIVTDTTFSNVAFFDGRMWVTPSTFLLNGTKRQYYIDKNVLKVADVRLTDIAKYKNISLINAMLDLEDIVIDIKNIHF
ncbi:aminotransferase class IV [Deferribacterales bacterium Es71-Z0220]|uniref:aminotransferase class IV n=1 Tax=Deferrivibrio essentukiensis TaxID=2880922 RepID=UPI001F5FF733|nr:aminotransferase class IV [Deferrivibrio essentukiensis]MCB4203432.1 aminotransferase class IV [Deferrivibrio essentukiensis]